MHGVVAHSVLGCPASTSAAAQGNWNRVRRPAVAAHMQRQQPACPAAAAAAAVPAGGRRQQQRHVPRLVASRASRHHAALTAAAEEEEAEEADVEKQEVGEEDEEVEWVEVGRVGQPHGVRGEMKVQPLTDFPEDRLGTPGPRWLQAPAPKIGRRKAEPPEEVELEWGRASVSKGNEVWLVKLEDVESPEEAALLRGHTLLIPASAREPLEDEDEFYVQDLVGLRVFLQDSGAEVGTVSDVFDGTGTHDVLRIQLAASFLEQLAAAAAAAAATPSSSSSGGEDEEEGEDDEGAGGGSGKGARHVLLPFAKEMVPVVDVKAGRMEITPPPGLLELAAPSSVKKARKEHRGKRERRRQRPRRSSAGEEGGAAAGAPSPPAGAPVQAGVE